SVLVLASPESNAAVPPVAKAHSLVSRPRGLLSWPVLRWGALAACIVVVSAAGLLLSRQNLQAPQRTATAQLDAPKAPVEVQTGTQDASAAQSSAKDTQKQALDFYAREELRAPSKLPAMVENRKKFVTLPDKPASKDAAALLALAPGVAERVEANEALPGPAAAAPSRAYADQVSIAAAAPAPSSSLAKDDAAADRKEASRVSQPNSAKAGQQNVPQVPSEVLEVTSEPASIQAETATVARNAAPETKAERDQAKSKLGIAEGKASNDVAATAAITSGNLLMHDVSSAKWTLSPDGLPQRSFDAGKTWEKMQVDHHTGFRALSAQGMNVWVGGLAGRLYHSSDVGMHWTRIIPVAENTTLASDIISMDFQDSMHGRLTTANQESWSTSDGGKTWQKE
ncbi:MAG: WD40/YVTN/BNR-like repeat-containing protein, partial [Acidobacteriota bacterium]